MSREEFIRIQTKLNLEEGMSPEWARFRAESCANYAWREEGLRLPEEIGLGQWLTLSRAQQDEFSRCGGIVNLDDLDPTGIDNLRRLNDAAQKDFEFGLEEAGISALDLREKWQTL